MNAFDMISEPVLFIEQLREHSSRVYQCVELIQSLADALLAEDHEQIRTLHEQMSEIRDAAEQSKLSLYRQITEMHFHSAGGDIFNQYVACQDKVADSSKAFAELLVLRKTAVPLELRDDFRALIAEVVNAGRRTMSLAEELFSRAQAVCAGAQGQSSIEAIQGNADDKVPSSRRETDFARRLYSLEKELDPVTITFLDKYHAALREVAQNADCAADHLRLMMR